MVEHEPQPGNRPDRGDSRRELRRAGEQVERQPGLGDGAQTALHVGAFEPVPVGLALHLVTHAAQPRTARGTSQPVELAGDRLRGEVDPTDHAGDERLTVGKGEQLLGLARDVVGLDDDGPRHAGGDDLREQLGQVERAVDGGERRIVQPGLGVHRQIPHVVVSVDDAHRRGQLVCSSLLVDRDRTIATRNITP